jgi:hypothetical protein
MERLLNCPNKKPGQPCIVTGRSYCNPHFVNRGYCRVETSSTSLDTPDSQYEQTEMDLGELSESPPLFPSIVQRGM